MKTLAVASFALFSLAARASSAEEPAPTPPEPPGLAAFEAEMMPATTAPGASSAAAPAAPAARDAARDGHGHRHAVAEETESVDAKEALSPQPDVGWGRGKRAPVYFNVMLLAEGFGEDPHYRLTTRSSRLLEGGGGLLRLGGNFGLHHRVGLRMQSFMRPTKKVLATSPSTVGTDEWGMVAFGYIGPEYLYTTESGIYFGGSLGVAGAMSQDRVDCHDHCGDCGTTNDHCGIDKGNVGGAAMASLGYELRMSKWFALNVEAFGGVYRGIDDDEKAMNGSIFGLGLGVGF